MDKVTQETEVSSSELACVLGITARRIRQLAEDGVLNRISEGRFNLADSVQSYMATLDKRKSVSSSEQEKLEVEISFKKARAIKATLEAKELQGKMHRSEDVAALTEDLIYSLRSGLMALPGRLAVDCASVSSAAEVAEIIKVEVHKLMEELSRYKYDPEKYAEKVRERQNWDSVDVDED